MSLPAGTITFLFADIEGSTSLWEKDAAAMRLALRQHNDILDEASAAHNGHHFKTIGDEYQIAFANPHDALAAALAAQRALTNDTWAGATSAAAVQAALRVRMGLHLGHVEVEGDDYAVSHVLNRASRIADAAHGGQILLSGELAGLLRGELPHEARLLDLGQYSLKGLARPEHLFQIQAPGLRADFPPPRASGSASRLGGRYERGALLGQGAMGTVYHGHDMVADRPVAIKVLRPEVLAADPHLLTASGMKAKPCAGSTIPILSKCWPCSNIKTSTT